MGMVLRDAPEAVDSDERLVAAVRRGDDRAFEILYQRYQQRIHAYVLGMVKDSGRAEDITQEVFVSALRRMRATDQPLAFKPWLYQIAKNSCIDAFRRSKRGEEVSYDAEDALAPGDASKLVGPEPTPDAAFAAKEDLESLWGAFGGLSDTHHEILLLRELEGHSYQEIGERLGMSRPAVESTLFRARRRLTEEYGEIVTGARCQRIQGIITVAAESSLGVRDRRRLARHVAHCKGCRREALAAGLDRRLITRPSVRERIAGLLPFPAFVKFGRGDADPSVPPSPGRFANWATHLPLWSDHAAGGWSKAAAGAAMLLAGVGTGMGVHEVATQPPSSSAAVQSPPARVASAPPSKRVETVAAGHKSSTTSSTSRAPTKPKRRSSGRVTASSSPSAADRATSGGGGPVQPADPNPTPPASKSDSRAPEEPPAEESRDRSAAARHPGDKASGAGQGHRLGGRPDRRQGGRDRRYHGQADDPDRRHHGQADNPDRRRHGQRPSPAAARCHRRSTRRRTPLIRSPAASPRPSTTPLRASPARSVGSPAGRAARLLCASGRGAAW